MTVSLTVNGRATHQVGIGEVERSVKLEVRLQHLPHPLTEVEEETSTLQRNLPLLSELREAKRIPMLFNSPAFIKGCTQWRAESVSGWLFNNDVRLCLMLQQQQSYRPWQRSGRWLPETSHWGSGGRGSPCSHHLSEQLPGKYSIFNTHGMMGWWADTQNGKHPYAENIQLLLKIQ